VTWRLSALAGSVTPWVRRLLAIPIAALLLSGWAGAAQTPFRSRTDLVSVYTTVTDRSGRLVPDLTKEDFELRDNGKPQRITFFSNDLQPITIVVMLDRSGSMQDNFELVQHAAQQFVTRLLPTDQARIGNFSRQIEISPASFTSDQGVLIDILQRGLQDVGPSPIWTALDRSITALLPKTGRRVVLVFTDGHDNPMRGQVVTDLKDVIRRATIDDVMVYAIGLADIEDVTSSWLAPRRFGQVQIGTRSKKLIKPDPGLRHLAEETGGGYFELRWDQNLGATFARVADELHRQYWLAFPPMKLDGEVHRLEVKVKRADLTARGRKSYVAEAR
jgi:Ca-activated chloride channel family protein